MFFIERIWDKVTWQLWFGKLDGVCWYHFLSSALPLSLLGLNLSPDSRNPRRSAILLPFLLSSLSTRDFPKLDVIVWQHFSCWRGFQSLLGLSCAARQEWILALYILASKELLHAPCWRITYRVLCASHVAFSRTNWENSDVTLFCLWFTWDRFFHFSWFQSGLGLFCLMLPNLVNWDTLLVPFNDHSWSTEP